jgi:hypothetical protein
MLGALVFLVSVLLLAGDPAQKPDPGPATNAVSLTLEDPGAGYDVYSYRTPTTIPDGDPAGVALGPIRIPKDGGAVEGVIVSVSITHPSTGDLALRLGYDANGDGHPEAVATLEPHLARPGGWAVREPYACPREMRGVYYYRDEPAGEYDDRGGASFSVFNGFPRGGSFTLTAVDSLAADEGVVLGWTVFLRRTNPRRGTVALSS